MLQAEITTQIALPPGFSARGATMADLPETIDFFNLCAVDLIGTEKFNLEEYRVEWEMPKFNPSEDTRLIFNPKGQIVGCVEVWAINDLPVTPWVWGRVHPNYNNLGLGTWLLQWAEERASQLTAKVPADLRLAMHLSAMSHHQPTKDLFENEGFRLVRHFWDMRIDFNGPLPEPQWPAGIKLLTYNHPAQLQSVVAAVQDAFRDHWGFIERPIAESVERWQHWIENDPTFDASIWYLAMDGDEIVAMSLCRIKADEDPDIGWVDTLGVRRPWRRKGLALALLHHSFAQFYQRGKKGVGLGVDASSLTGATRLYEKAGMHAERQYDRYEKELRPGRDLATRSVD